MREVETENTRTGAYYRRNTKNGNWKRTLENDYKDVPRRCTGKRQKKLPVHF
jgi:hypothetical protein